MRARASQVCIVSSGEKQKGKWERAEDPGTLPSIPVSIYDEEKKKKKHKKDKKKEEKRKHKHRHEEKKTKKHDKEKKHKKEKKEHVILSVCQQRGYSFIRSPKAEFQTKTAMFYTCSKCGKLVRQCNAVKHQKKCGDSVMHCCDCGQEVKTEELSNHTKCPNGMFSSLPPLFNPNSVLTVKQE